jgi:hypothetical protein
MNDLALEGFDLLVSDGDLVVAASRDQHASLLLAFSQGHLRKDPLAGVNLPAWLNAPATLETRNALAARLLRQMAVDGLGPGLVEVDVDYNIIIT